VQAADGKVKMHNVNGEMLFESSLARIPFPKDGEFMFKNI